MKKLVFYTEVAYILGLLMLAFGTALMSKGDYGISMIVAPAYILFLKVSQFWAFFSFGLAEYLLQAVILILMMLILKKVKLVYLLTFLTTIIYGAVLNFAMDIIPNPNASNYILRGGYYIGGIILCTASLAFWFKSYFPPAAYEVFVKNISKRFNVKLFTFKTIFDCSCCIIAAVMSLLFFGEFRGVGIGTVLCALIYGTLIGLFTKLFEYFWNFKDKFKFRSFFEEREEEK